MSLCGYQGKDFVLEQLFINPNVLISLEFVVFNLSIKIR